MVLSKISEINGYSVYDNPNIELRNQIREYVKNTEVVIDGIRPFYGQNFKLARITDSGKYLMEGSGGDFITISPEEYDDKINNLLLFKINQEFNVVDYLNSKVLPFIDSTGNVVTHVKDLSEVAGEITSMNQYGNQYLFEGVEYRPEINTTNYIGGSKATRFSFTKQKTLKQFKCYYDTEGYIRNLDMFLNFNVHTEEVTREDNFAEFIEFFQGLNENEFKYGDERWFTDSYVIILDNDFDNENGGELVFTQIPKQKSDRNNLKTYYITGDSRWTTIKEPKTGLIPVSKDHLLSFVMDRLNTLK